MKKKMIYFIAIAMFFIAGQHAASAQVVSNLIWRDDAPQTVPHTLVALGDVGYVYINVRLVAKPAETLRLELVLPTGVEFARVDNGNNASTNSKQMLYNETGVTTPTSYFGNATLSGTAANGDRKLVIYYTRNSGTLDIGDSLIMKIAVKATCGVDIFNPGTFKINFYATDILLGGYREIQASVQKATMRIYATPGYEIVNYTQVKDTNTVSLNIDAQNGYVKSFRTMFTYNPQIIYLDSFKIDGRTIPASQIVYNPATVTTQTSRTVTITVNQTDLDGYVTGVARTLTFRASSNLGCNQYINSELWYDATYTKANAQSQCANWWQGNQIILQLPSDGVAPAFTSLKPEEYPTYSSTGQAVEMRTIPYFNMEDTGDYTASTVYIADSKRNNFNYFCWDGTTPNYGAIVFKNTNAAPTASFRFWTEMNHGSNLSRCEYIDTAQIYWRASVPSKIDGKDSIVIPLQKLPSRFVTNYANEYGTDTTIYNPVLIGKDRGITINLPVDNDHQLPAGVKIEIQWVVYANPQWIKDDYRARSAYKAYQRSYNNISYRWSDLVAGNTCNQTFSWAPNSYQTVLYKPRFYVDAQQQLTVYPSTPYTYSNYCMTHAYATSTSDGMYTQVYVKLPSWLNLDTTAGGGIESAFTIASNKPTSNTGIYHGIENGYKVYSVKYLYAYRDRTSTSPFYYPGTAAEWNTYQADSMKNNLSGLLNIKTIPDACGANSGILTDTMQVWFDFQGGNVQSGDCRGLFKKTSKLFSVVNYNCQLRALVIDDFGPYRYTRGYKDVLSNDGLNTAGQDHYPDDGTLVPDSLMEHWHYLLYDTGYYYIKGYVEGTASDEWDQLVAVLGYKTGGALLATALYKWGNTSSHAQPFWNDATIEIKRWNADTTAVIFQGSFPLNIPVVNNLDSLTVYYNGVENGFIPRGGDSVIMKIPFRVIAGIDSDRGSIDCKTYGIKENKPDVLDGMHSFDPIKISYKTLNAANRAGSTWTKTFNAACDVKTLGYNNAEDREYGLYAGAYWHGGADNDEWKNEVRVLYNKMTFTIRIPAGYSRTKSTVDFNFQKYEDRIWTPTASDNQTIGATNHIAVLPISATEDYSTHDSILVFDFSNVYDYDYQNYGKNGKTYNATTGYLSDGKLPIGDDGMGGRFIMPLIATPTCASSNTISGTNVNSTGACFFTFTDIYGGTRNISTETSYMIYNGPRLYLETSPQLVYVNSQQLSLSSVKLQNSHGEITDNNVWMYVKGRVENAYLINGNDTLHGTGLDNCWLSIGTLTPLQIKNCRLVFDYKGKEACGQNDTICVYTVFDAMSNGYNPNTAYPIDSVNLCNRGTYQYTILESESPRAKIAGKVTPSIPNSVNPSKAGYMHHDDPYCVIWQIDGRVSQGALNDPYVVITVPAGQIYVDTTVAYGAAQFEYPLGTWNPMPAAILAKIEDKFGSASDNTLNRIDTLHAKDLIEALTFMMPGWGSDPFFGFTDSMRVMNIRIPFIPDCETELFGLRFSGVFHGTKSCGDPVEDDGMIAYSRTIYPDVLPEYSFQVTLENLDMTNRFYTPDKNEDYFIATFHKDLGAAWIDNTGKAIQTTDYVRLRMPADLSINGPVVSPQFDTISVLHEEIDANGDRVYHLSFPAQALNDSMPHLMDSMTFTYRIPFLFTPNPLGGCSSPKEEIVCQVMTNVNFAPGVCTARPASVGSGELLLLTSSLENATFLVCVNMPAHLVIACSGVTPVWYRDAVGTGGELGHNNWHDYTPVTATPDTFWVRGIYDYGGDEEEDFGMAYVIVQKHPRIKPNFSADTVCYGSVTHFTNLTYIGTDPSTAVNTQKWYWYKDGESTPFDSVQHPVTALAAGIHNIRLYVRDINICIADTTIRVLVNSLPVPDITGNNILCFKDTAVYYTDKGMNNYTWSVTNGSIVSAATDLDSLVVCWNVSSGAGNNGTVNVNYTDANGCMASSPSSRTVQIRDLPAIPAIQGNNTVCINTLTTYTYTTQPDISTFIWTLNGGGTTDRTDTALIHVNWTALGNYELSLSVVNRFGCAADSAGKFKVKVTGSVSPFISGSDTVCKEITGEVYNTAAGMQSYTWTVQGGNIVNGQNSNSISVDWTTADKGYVSVEITDNDGCSDTSNRFPVYVRGTFSITCPSDIYAELPSGQLSMLITDADLGTPTVTYSKTPSTFTDVDVSVTNDNISVPRGIGLDTVIWKVTDNRCPNISPDSCIQRIEVAFQPCPASVQDNDGNTYTVVRIGCNCWTIENLVSETYADGTPVTPAPAIYHSSQHANSAANLAEYGYLYTYAAATHGGSNGAQGICPNGWHLPALSEWKCVMDDYSSKEMKMNGVGYWLGETDITNTSNFSGKPAGYYDTGTGGSFRLLGDAWFWMYDPISLGSTTLSCHIFFGCPEVLSDIIDKAWAVSVRCVKD
jgi:uncharacterized protein (TIGR02145 family)